LGEFGLEHLAYTRVKFVIGGQPTQELCL
jgi:hypothetical protein